MPLRRRKCLDLPPPPRTRSQDSRSPQNTRSLSSPPHSCHDEDYHISEDLYKHMLSTPRKLRGRHYNLANISSPVTRQPSRSSNHHSSHPTSPSGKAVDSVEFLQTLSDLTAALNNLAHQQNVEKPYAGTAPDANFDWQKLLMPPPTSFPKANEGQVQLLAEGLLSKLHTLPSEELQDVMFALSVASQYPVLNASVQNIVYQRLNLLYIATHHGWKEAASSVAAASAAVLPPGYHLGAVTGHHKPNHQRNQQGNSTGEREDVIKSAITLYQDY